MYFITGQKEYLDLISRCGDSLQTETQMEIWYRNYTEILHSEPLLAFHDPLLTILHLTHLEAKS